MLGAKGSKRGHRLLKGGHIITRSVCIPLTKFERVQMMGSLKKNLKKKESPRMTDYFECEYIIDASGIIFRKKRFFFVFFFCESEYQPCW